MRTNKQTVTYLCFFGSFIFLLLAFHKLLEPNRHFTSKMNSSVHNGFTGLKHKQKNSIVS